MKTLTDVNGVTTEYFYDGFGRLSKVVGPDDQDSFYGSISYQYHVGSPGNNYVESFETEEYGTKEHRYRKESKDGFGQVVRTVEDGENGETIYTRNTYDYRGNLVRSSLPGFGAPGPDIVNSYDTFDRVTQGVQPGGYTTIFSYSGWQTTVTDANSHSKTLTRDSRDRVAQVLEPGSFTTRYPYDVFDHLTSITDHLGNVWTYEYDSLGRKTVENDPDLGRSTFEYDDNGNLTQKTDAMNRVMTYVYDGLNRINRKDDLTTPGLEERYFYEEPESSFGIGRRTRMVDPSSETRFHYDNEGRIAREEVTVTGFNGPFTTEWTYDAMDRVKKITLPNARAVEFTDNDQGLVETIPGFLADADYEASGEPKQYEFSNGLTTNYTYHTEDKRLIRIHSGSFMDFNYRYDSVGNVTQIRDDAKLWTKDYTYDDLDRLLSGDGETFSYDAIGNITMKNGVPQLYEGSQPHSLTSDGANAYVYDAVGSMRSGAGRAIDYDAENRPVRIVRDGVTTQFLYHGDGERVVKIVSDGFSTRKTLYIANLYEKEIVS